MKHVLSTFCILLTAVAAQAAPITLEKARENAMAFLTSGNMQQRVKGNRSLKLAYTRNGTKGVAAPLFHVFNIGDGGGFVIVSGDDVVPAILGYGDEGRFDIDSIPCGLRMWFDMTSEWIAMARVKGVQAPSAAAATNSNRLDVPPLIDVVWGQGQPYNDQCVFDGVRCATGCVATAAAQIAYYWGKGKSGRQFRHGCCALSGYDGWFHQVPALDELESFDWDAMTMTDGVPDTEDSKAAVAQLMRYCGQAAITQYASSSGAFLTSEIFASFGYKCDFKRYYDANASLQGDWNTRLYQQLLKGFPIIFGGVKYDQDGDEPHAFICDGYQASTDRFHINWGWDGFGNGYYWLDYLEPYYCEISRESIEEYPEYNVPGYTDLVMFSDLSPWQAYKVFENNQLTYYYDGNLNSREGAIYMMDIYNKMNDGPVKSEIKKVVIDESFADYRLIPSFANFYEVEEYEGLEYLKTHITSMSYMFYKNKKIKHLDLSCFNTSNIKSMYSMFYECSKLESVDVHTFNTSNVTDMTDMFYGCESLGSLDLSNFQIGYETSTSRMLANMPNLSSLKISSSMKRLNENACNGTGTRLSPCVIQAPQGFDFGTATDGPYFVWKSGCFRLPGSYAWGDVNHDGEVNITDVTLTVNKVLGNEATDFYIRNADINEDNMLNITDVTHIVNIILK